MSSAGVSSIAIRGADSAPVARPAPLSLRRNFAWGLTGNVVYAACQWSMLALLARLTWPEVVGRYALGLAIGTPIFLFANLNLAQVQATDARGEFSLIEVRVKRFVAWSAVATMYEAFARAGGSTEGATRSAAAPKSAGSGIDKESD